MTVRQHTTVGEARCAAARGGLRPSETGAEEGVAPGEALEVRVARHADRERAEHERRGSDEVEQQAAAEMAP
jgi:hypothetical protein